MFKKSLLIHHVAITSANSFWGPLQERLAPHYGNNVLFVCNIGVLWPNG